MTISSMSRVVVATVIVAGVTAAATLALAGRDPTMDPEQARELTAAQETAEEALRASTALEGRVDSLAESLESAESSASRFKGRVERTVKRLRTALDRLRSALDRAKTSSSDALARADAAAAAVDKAARDLAILEQRYDTHLVRYHGGG